MEESEDRPWEGPGLRRDPEIERGRLLSSLSVASVCLGTFSLYFPISIVFVVFGLPFSIWVYVTARRDMQGILTGRVDVRGQESTAKALERSRIGIGLCLVGLCLWLLLAVLIIFMKPQIVAEWCP
jgi:hypothetical protein